MNIKKKPLKPPATTPVLTRPGAGRPLDPQPGVQIKQPVAPSIAMPSLSRLALPPVRKTTQKS